MMIAFIALMGVLASASAQFPYQQLQGHQPSYQQPQQAYRPQPAQYQPQPQSYQPQPQSYQPQQPAYQPPPQAYQAPRTQAPQRTINPAAVHYVNIGAELAGDYKFGYDTGKGADQSFREETRLPDGSVKGAYGYVDETGKQRIIRYTAGKDGYQVEGDGIPKAPAAPAPAPAQAAPVNPNYGGAYGGNQQYGSNQQYGGNSYH